MLNIVEEDSEEEEFEEADLSLTLPSDQTTVIDNQTTVIDLAASVKPETTENLVQQSVLNVEPSGEEKPKINHWLIDKPIFESKENRQARERALSDVEYIQSRTWIEYLKETQRYYSDELTKYGNYHSEYFLHYDDDNLPYYRGRRSEVYNEVRETQYIGPVTPENYLE